MAIVPVDAKRLVKSAVMIGLLLFLSGCLFSPPITFEDVSQPYLAMYGPPEETSSYDASGYHTVDWWWWSLGHQVTFADLEGDGVNGWKVYSTYDFDPI